MQTPLQITFRSIGHSNELAAHLQERADKLDEIFDRIISCHVVVERDGHHHRDGDRFRLHQRQLSPGTSYSSTTLYGPGSRCRECADNRRPCLRRR